MSTAPALDTNASATPSVFNEEVLLMAEKIGELSDRFAKIESEFTAQTAPLDGAKAAQEAALTALSAALKGIEQLNFHVLQNNLGAVSTRIEKVDANWQAKARELGVTIKRIDDALVEVASQLRSELAAGNKSRVEFGRNVATETGAVKTMLGEIGGRLASLQSDFAQRIEAARKEFATPTTLNPRGDWSPRETYERLDVVTLNGTSYIAQRQTQEKPSARAKDWQVLARRSGALIAGGDTALPPVGNFTTLNVSGIATAGSFASDFFDAVGSAGGFLRNASGVNQLGWGAGGGSNLSLLVATNINPANASVSIAPTGTGTVTINPATAGTINRMSIGGTTPSTGAFTTLSATARITQSGVTAQGANPIGILVQPTAGNDATGTSTGMFSNFGLAPDTVATNLRQFVANQGAFGAGSSVTTQVGFLANSTLTGATNNYGFQGQLTAATGRYNLYMSGTAQNYLEGKTGIGQLPSATDTLAVTGTTLLNGNTAVTGTLSSTGALAIGNTVNTVSPTSPNRTITMVIGGTTYYIHAKTTND
jgi:hypothetical protein